MLRVSVFRGCHVLLTGIECLLTAEDSAPRQGIDGVDAAEDGACVSVDVVDVE